MEDKPWMQQIETPNPLVTHTNFERMQADAALPVEPRGLVMPNRSPPHWCHVCHKDLQSAANLEIHKGGRKHRNQAATVSVSARLQPIVLPAIKARTIGFFKRPPRDNIEVHPVKPRELEKQASEYRAACALLYSQDLDSTNMDDNARMFQLEVDHMEGYPEKLGELASEDRAACAIRDSEDIDYTNMDDYARMFQLEFDHAVVAVALYNYETFHGMEHGTVYYKHVYDSSAGIEGWAAACTVDNDVQGSKLEETASNETGDKNTWPVLVQKEVAHKGDTEEAIMLGRAMMESMLESRGVCTPFITDLEEGMPLGASVYEEEEGDDDGEEGYCYDEDEYLDKNGDDEEEMQGLSQSYDELNIGEQEDASESSNDYAEPPRCQSACASEGSWSQVTDASDSSLSDPVLVAGEMHVHCSDSDWSAIEDGSSFDM